MSDKLINKTNMQQTLAIEYFALKPNVTCKEVSEKLGIPLRTLSAWRSNPDFGEAVYKRAMVEFGLELPAVIKSCFNEGKNGNVQAQRLILEHFGKLTKNNVNIIISPFEQFLENNGVGNKKSTEVKFEEIPNIEPEDVQVKTDANKKGRVKKEKIKNFKQMQKEVAKHKRNLKQKEWYQWKKRAKAVGVSPMKSKRPTQLQRKEWEQSIIDKEQLSDSKK